MRRASIRATRALLIALACWSVACAGGRVPDGEFTDGDSRGQEPPEFVAGAGDNSFPSGYEVVTIDGDARTSYAPRFDILHSEIELFFDFEGEYARGRVTHYLVVLGRGLSEIVLHAEGLAIQSAEITRGRNAIRSEFEVEGGRLLIRPGAPLRRSDTLSVAVGYSSLPARSTTPVVYFSDAAGTDPFAPTQVWAGGEASAERPWFPTWDHPAERSTFTVQLIVPDSLISMASGELVHQQAEASGQRRDIWSVEVPQPAHRVGFAIGGFHEIQDEYQSPVGKRSSLVYATEPKLASLTEGAFASVPSMLQFLERRTAAEYPFPEYSAAVVRRLPAEGPGLAAMSLFDPSVLRDARALLDESADGSIVRMIAGQWFGSWVGATEWSDLPMLEGLQKVFEWAYLEEIFGAVAAEEAIVASKARYLDEATRARRPVVAGGGDDPYRFGDVHSVDKSALALRQLSFVVGDETWWRALREFAARGGQRTASIDDLREAVEQAARRPLRVYFDQWFNSAGHPEIVVDHEYDAEVGIYSMRVRQVHDTSAFPVFTIDSSVEIGFESRPEYRERVLIASVDTTLRFGVSGRISYALLDGESRLLADIRENKPTLQWLWQAEQHGRVGGRIEALKALSRSPMSEPIRSTLVDVAAADPSPMVRAAAVGALAEYRSSPAVFRFLRERAVTDAAPTCRAAALRMLGDSGDPSAIATMRRALADSSYLVVAEAVGGLARLAPEDLWSTVEPITGAASWQGVVETAVAEALESRPDSRAVPYLRRLTEPGNPESVRLAALTALYQLARVDEDWRTRVKSVLETQLPDRSEAVRMRARDLLRNL